MSDPAYEPHAKFRCDECRASMKRKHQNTAFVFSLMDFIFGFLWMGSVVYGTGFFGLIMSIICFGTALYFMWHSDD